MRIVVTGSKGDLGHRVVHHLDGADLDVVEASRRSGVDLRNGAGLEAALDGADAVVHCATSQRHADQVDVGGAQRIHDIVAAQSNPAHVVVISIVGCDRVPYPYYRAKVASEKAVSTGRIPATVVRATQFHALAAMFASAGRLGPLTPTIGDMGIQPVDIDWVAATLAEVATGPRPDGAERHHDLAGPDVFTAREIAELVAAHDGRRAPRMVRIPPVGGMMRAFSEGAVIPDPSRHPVEIGGRTFEGWLATRPSPLPRAFHDSAPPSR